jgi:magnesium transporter
MQPQLPHQQKNRRIKRLHKRKTGLPPGTLLYTGEKKSSEITVHRIAYNTTNYAEKIFTDGNKLNLEVPEDSVLWLNINGLHNEKFIESIGNHFGLHNLILEDILNVFQIPKAEEYPETDQFYITLNEFYIDDQGKLNRDQISLLLGKGYLLSFQEEEGDYFEQIRERLRTAKGKLRKKHADYLLYVLLDSIVDSYYIILDQYSGQIDVVEDSIFEKKNTNHLETIHQLNKDMIFLRRSIAPLQEILFRLLKEDAVLIEDETRLFLRDVLDHVQQVVSQIDVDREFLADLVQTNMANMNSHLNEIIKLLTLISTIFIPLTFIVGVYGMNFESIPLLHRPNGYFIVWGAMILISVIQILIFKKKKWL